MSNLNNKLEDLLPSFFQSHITIVCDGKTIVDGRLVIFNVRHFAFVLTVRKKKGNLCKVVVPRPFNCDKYDGNHILCDYRFATLADGDKKLLSSLRKIKVYEKSTYYDKVMEIVRIPPVVESDDVEIGCRAEARGRKTVIAV